MVSFAPTCAETLADRELYLSGQLAEVSCLDCTAVVKVRKNSPQHTSVQWSAESASACQFFARQDQEGRRSIVDACPRLRSSIESAVRDGVLPVGAISEPSADPA